MQLGYVSRLFDANQLPNREDSSTISSRRVESSHPYREDSRGGCQRARKCKGIKALAAGWPVWNSEQEGNGETFHIDYDGDYGSERVCSSSLDVPPL